MANYLLHFRAQPDIERSLNGFASGLFRALGSKGHRDTRDADVADALIIVTQEAQQSDRERFYDSSGRFVPTILIVPSRHLDPDLFHVTFFDSENPDDEAYLERDVPGTFLRVVAILDGIEPTASEVNLSASQALRLEVEAFVTMWARLSPDLPLSTDERRIGDALASMVSEVIKTDEPPRGILTAAFHWFAHKADVVAEEAAKTFGKGVGAGAGVAVTGQLPSLLALISRVGDLVRQI